MFNGINITLLRQIQSIAENIDPYEPIASRDPSQPIRSISNKNPVIFDPQLGAKSNSSATPSGDEQAVSESISSWSASHNGIRRKFYPYDKEKMKTEETNYFSQEMPSNA